MQNEILIAFVIGLGLGIFLGYYFARKKILLFSRFEMQHLEKTISIIFTLAWFGMHVYGFFYDKDVAVMFDVVGMGAMAHLIGLDIGTLLDKYFKGKK